MTLRVWALFFFAVTGCYAFAQAKADASCPTTVDVQGNSIRYTDCKGRVRIEAVPEPTPGTGIRDRSDASLDSSCAASAACRKYLDDYYNHQSHLLGYTLRVYQWQYWSSIVIFVMVVLLVLSGLAFAGIQFAIAMKVQPSKIAKETSGNAENGEGEGSSAMVSTIEASVHGLKITSSVIGLLILVVSMGFFYLYLAHVYPIETTGQKQVAPQGSPK